MVRRCLVLVLAFVMTAPALFAQARLTAERFVIVIDGFELASFTELGSIGAEGKTLATFEDTTSGRGIATLSRLATANQDMWAWHDAARDNLTAAKKDFSLIGYNRRGDPVQRYYVTSGWPAKVEIRGLKVGASEVLMETVTFVAERIQRVAP
jgi:phage tail-like protein